MSVIQIIPDEFNTQLRYRWQTRNCPPLMPTLHHPLRTGAITNVHNFASVAL